MCERYNTQSNSWQNIKSLNYNAVASSVCSFNKNIYKFGGLIDGESINKYIEMYDALLNNWTVIDVKLDNK